MSYSPINPLNLKRVQIAISGSTISNTTTPVTLGSISDSSVVTIASNKITLPTGRSYFVNAALNFSQASGNNVEFRFVNSTTLVAMPFQNTAYAYYAGTAQNIETYGGTLQLIVSQGTNLTIEIRKTIHTAATTIYQDNANTAIANSSIDIFYTD
jgi:hypothetical protein